MGIACGKQHSLCITQKKKIYSWGTGSGGRLGHGNDDDVLVPKDISDLSKRKIIFISAGESHSAAITERLKLFTWGTGTYGRLGSGQFLTEKIPKEVEEMKSYECVYVSCGAFHSFCITGEG